MSIESGDDDGGWIVRKNRTGAGRPDPDAARRAAAPRAVRERPPPVEEEPAAGERADRGVFRLKPRLARAIEDAAMRDELAGPPPPAASRDPADLADAARVARDLLRAPAPAGAAAATPGAAAAAAPRADLHWSERWRTAAEWAAIKKRQAAQGFTLDERPVRGARRAPTAEERDAEHWRIGLRDADQ